MANDLNQVVVVGRLTRDAELRFTQTGTAISRMSIAVNRRKRSGDNQWADEVSYFDVVLWGKIAESLQSYLTKGKQIAVSGELRQNRWEQDGQKRSKVEIVATNVQLLGGRGDSMGAPMGSSMNSNMGSAMGSAPSQGAYADFQQVQGFQSAQSFQPQASVPSGDDFDDDEIPF